VIGELLVEPTVTTLVLHGEFDLVTVDGLRSLLAEARRVPAPQLVVEVSDASFIDVLSLSAILATADAARTEGSTLVIRGARPALRRMCALLNAEDVLELDVPVPRVASN
jgi:anti-anti-sigma factor